MAEGVAGAAGAVGQSAAAAVAAKDGVATSAAPDATTAATRIATASTICSRRPIPWRHKGPPMPRPARKVIGPSVSVRSDASAGVAGIATATARATAA